MLDQGCLPNRSTYFILIEGFCESGMKEVDEVVSMAIASGGIDSDSWDLFLNKVVSNVDSGTGVLDVLLKENVT
uniref:Pentatricopeptide repeat-containing protein n=1 Tax=Rhizophora mucronata TaxID=61149 RepID=A0A2P2J2B6_RHIMU